MGRMRAALWVERTNSIDEDKVVPACAFANREVVRKYEGWLAALMESCRVLNVDEHTAERYAEVRADLRRGGQPIPGNDVWLAALARQHALPILSRDRHFDFVPGLRRISW